MNNTLRPIDIEKHIFAHDVQWLVTQFDTNNAEFVENFPNYLNETQIKRLCQDVFDFYKEVGFSQYRHLSEVVEGYEETTHLNMSCTLGGCTIGDARPSDGRVRLSKNWLFNRSAQDLANVVFETIPHELAHVVHFGIVYARPVVSTEECIRLRDASWGKPKSPFGRPYPLSHGKIWKRIYSDMTGWKIKNRFFKGMVTKSEAK